MSGRQKQETPTSGLRRSHQIDDVESGSRRRCGRRRPYTMIDNQEQYLRQAAKANRERLAVAHRDSVMQEEATRAADVRHNMARLKELRLAKRNTRNPDGNRLSKRCKTELEKTIQMKAAIS